MKRTDPKIKNVLENINRYRTDPKLKKAIEDFMDEHALKKIEVGMVNSATGKRRVKKEARITLVLTKLFDLVMAPGYNYRAYKIWMDRSMGRVPPARRAARKTRKERFSRYF
jgi:tyrosine-protein phosphatase YwqE